MGNDWGPPHTLGHGNFPTSYRFLISHLHRLFGRLVQSHPCLAPPSPRLPNWSIEANKPMSPENDLNNPNNRGQCIDEHDR